MADEANKERKVYIDIAKGIGILLVLFGHLLPGDSFVKSAIYSFHMPLFFFVSGGVLKYCPFKDFLKKRWRQILVPYVLWALIFASFSLKNCALIAYGTNESLLAAGSNGMLWFLPAMFIGSAIAWAVVTYVKDNRLQGVIVLALLLLSTILKFVKGEVEFFEEYGLPFAIDVACLAAAFILTGKLATPFLKSKLDNFRIPVIAALGIILVTFSCLGNLMQTEKGYPQMATLDVGNIIIYFIVAVVSVIGVVCLSIALDGTSIVSKGLSWLGRNSLLLFVTHRIFVYYLKEIYEAYINILVLVACFAILLVCATVSTIVIGYFLPVLAGKQKNN